MWLWFKVGVVVSSLLEGHPWGHFITFACTLGRRRGHFTMFNLPWGIQEGTYNSIFCYKNNIIRDLYPFYACIIFVIKWAACVTEFKSLPKNFTQVRLYFTYFDTKQFHACQKEEVQTVSASLVALRWCAF